MRATVEVGPREGELTDFKGREIFEGDICEEVSPSGRRSHKSVVEFFDGTFHLCHDHFDLRGEKTGRYEQVLGFLTQPAVEIVGSINENPEPLNAK
ncbi:YopX family protein [Pseudooceanicola nanhaiensis]|uniref:YopX family protein n=1 Tax=Pseudooceanicola nanhaiensis TaxID=375761 RepID=UPI0035177D53